MAVDLEKFRKTRPYASQLYGVYQPLLGWKSAAQKSRLTKGLGSALAVRVTDVMERAVDRPVQQREATREPTRLRARATVAPFATDVGRSLAERLTTFSSEDIRASFSRSAVSEALKTAKARLEDAPAKEKEAALAQEEAAAEAIVELGEALDDHEMRLLMANVRPAVTIAEVAKEMRWLTSLLDPAESDMLRAAIAPIGIVHLYRQYFFEFDSFLGPSVQHVWMSPGSTLELIEVTSRKQLIERVIEQASESVERSERETSLEDELSELQKEENARNTKIGVSLSNTFNVGTAFISNSTNVSASLNYDTSQRTAREETHRTRRGQSEKVSSELKQSFKSMFRTVTETTDTQSKRYVLTNTTDKLLNYELRRKMRQVGVQLQDVGTNLCWQVYVDAPGRELGIADLLHVAQPSDVAPIQDPARPTPLAEYADPPFPIEWTWKSNDDRWRVGMRVIADKLVIPKPGFVYSRSEVRVIRGENWAFGTWPQGDTPDGHRQSVAYQVGRQSPASIAIEANQIPAPNGETERSVTKIWIGMLILREMEDDDDHPFTLEVTIYYKPSRQALFELDTAYKASLAAATQERARLYAESLFKSARDRVKAASLIQPRRFDDLREEERIVIYRNLIRQLLEVAGVTGASESLRYVFAEVVQSIFDVDQMLYFVAPEWWQPRPLVEPVAPAEAGDPDYFKPIGSGLQKQAGWNGPQSIRPDNYLITEESAPAPLGRSLGWLIQLDGDTPRNAFLNAPWVKAVVPIRPGMEFRALDWLSDDAIEGSDGLSAIYAAKDDAERDAMLTDLRDHPWTQSALRDRYAALAASGLTILDAIRAIIIRVQSKWEEARKVAPDPNGDPDASVGSLPVDRVYEFGFAPIDGFKAEGVTDFEVFDQWIETVPTEQIVPVEVQYDPRTGAMLDLVGERGGEGDGETSQTWPEVEARIFVLITAAEQETGARALAQRLVASFPNAEIVEDYAVQEDEAPDKSQVRHFYFDDRDAAELVAALATSHLEFDVSVEFQPWASGNAAPGELKLLIGRAVES